MIYELNKFLRLFYEGVGNVNYEFPASGAAGVVNAANDGLSTDLATGKIAQLGQAVGRGGDPAQLLEPREIPFNSLSITMRNVFAQDSILFDEGEIIITGNHASGTGAGGGHLEVTDISGGGNFDVLATNLDLTIMLSSLFTRVTTALPNIWDFRGGIQLRDGLAAKIRATTSAIIVPLNNDYLILVDTTAGNAVVNITPANLMNGQILNIKKVSTDANTITLTMLSGTILGVPPAAATFVFGSPGESISFMSDTVNSYII